MMPFVEYLKAAGIAPITLVSCGESIAIQGNGQRYDSGSLWTDARYRRRIVCRATEQFRREVVGHDGVEQQQALKQQALRQRALAALDLAATHYRMRLTPHDVIVGRATQMSLQLDHCLEEMAACGTLKLFHSEYARCRKLNLNRGAGYMNFVTAQRRFRFALIARLVGLHQTTDRGLIEKVLGMNTLCKQYWYRVVEGTNKVGVRHQVTMSVQPTEAEVFAVLKSHLQGTPFQIMIIDDGNSCDMFVSQEEQQAKTAPRNECATELFLAHHNADHPRSIRHRPAIHGPAVIFDEIVLPTN